VSDEHDHQRGDRRRYRIAGLGGLPGSSTTAPIGHVDDIAAAYALGALEPDETEAVEAHVRGCALCERAISDAQRTAGMLSFLVPLHAPPPDSKAALFARVAHAQKAAAASSLPMHQHQGEIWRTPTIPSSAGVDLVQPTPSGSASAPSAGHARASRMGVLVSALSVPLLIALVATGFWGLQLREQLSSQNAQLGELQAELANFGSGTTSYQLAPGMAAPQAEGQIVMGADQRAGMLQIDVNSDDGPRSFELLLNQDGKLVPAAEVTVDQDGLGQARFELPKPFSEYESVHIKAKAIDSAADIQQYDDTLLRDNGGALGSTGSSLDVGP
jgi:hypothetical protein